MKRKLGTKNCAFCHLTLMIPNKEVKKVLFMGVLKKGKRKHECIMPLIESDLALSKTTKIQMRCFRLKETTQNFILFPDAATVFVNTFLLKDFTPIHRQSSLKYRKDEPSYMEPKHLLPKENKIMLTERFSTK